MAAVVAAALLLGGCGGGEDLATLARSGPESDRLVATEARRLCEMERAVFDSPADLDAFTDKLLEEAGLTRERWEAWRTSLDADTRADVNALYDRLCR